MSDYTDIDTVELQEIYDAIGQELSARDNAKRKDVAAMISEMAVSIGMRAELMPLLIVEPVKKGNGSGKDKAPRPAKYHNPANSDQMWTGRGKRPGWYREQLAAGVSPDQMLIGSDL